MLLFILNYIYKYKLIIYIIYSIYHNNLKSCIVFEECWSSFSSSCIVVVVVDVDKIVLPQVVSFHESIGRKIRSYTHSANLAWIDDSESLERGKIAFNQEWMIKSRVGRVVSSKVNEDNAAILA